MIHADSSNAPMRLAQNCAKNDNADMCLTALAWSCHPTWRVVLIGNRDEFHDRPTAALATWADTSVAVHAGRDLRSGGTWMGANDRGHAAVVTNVRDPLITREGPSRGQLVSGFLAGEEDASNRAGRIAGVAGSYAPFNLLLVDAEQCVYVGNHPAIASRMLEPGIHAMSNGPLDGPWPKSLRLARALQAWVDAGDPSLDPLWTALADDHQADDAALPDTGIGLERERWLSSAFIHGAQYGTRASTVLAIAHDNTGVIIERRFGPDGVALGTTTLQIGPR